MTDSVRTPMSSAVCANEAKVGPIASGPPGQVKRGTWMSRCISRPPVPGEGSAWRVRAEGASTVRRPPPKGRTRRAGGGATYDAPVTPSVEEIAGMTDPVLRNLHITQRYHELAIGLRDAGVGEDATWCAFAVWASKTAGATIRGEVLPARVRQLLVDNGATQDILHRFNHGVGAWAAEHLVHDHLGRAVDEVTADVATSIAGGNVLVFA